MPGAEALLAALREAQIPMGIVSNKLGDLLRREVAHLGWSDYFFGIVGAQDAEFDKPHPAPIHLLLEKAGIEAGPAVWLVGDTDIDIRAALAAGCSALLVGPGPQDSSLLMDAATSQRFDDCHALAGFVRTVRSTISQGSPG